MEESALNAHVEAVLRLLAEQQNVLISGSPGTGKSVLLRRVAERFQAPPAQSTGPTLAPTARIPLPSRGTLPTWMPSHQRSERKVFPTVFDQKTKYRDFLRGLVPSVSGENDSGVRFRVSRGTMYRANEHALTPTGVALVTIDEINRGPAVQIFGDSIVAIERDKRRRSDNLVDSARTAEFELLDDAGEAKLYSLSPHLYLLAAMNQADTSVEPLDVAFQRRWTPYRLEPDATVLASYFGVPVPTTEPPALPDAPATAAHVYTAVIRAWRAVNRRIALGRGQEFQIGHGVMMRETPPPVDTVEKALAFVGPGWSRIRAHVEEVFFGDIRSMAAALNVPGTAGHPYALRQHTFADQRVFELVAAPLAGSELYGLLRAVAGGV